MQPKNVLPAWWAKRLCMVRHFAQYVSAFDKRTRIPPQGLLPHRYRRRSVAADFSPRSTVEIKY